MNKSRKHYFFSFGIYSKLFLLIFHFHCSELQAWIIIFTLMQKKYYFRSQTSERIPRIISSSDVRYSIEHNKLFISLRRIQHTIMAKNALILFVRPNAKMHSTRIAEKQFTSTNRQHFEQTYQIPRPFILSVCSLHYAANACGRKFSVRFQRRTKKKRTKIKPKTNAEIHLKRAAEMGNELAVFNAFSQPKVAINSKQDSKSNGCEKAWGKNWQSWVVHLFDIKWSFQNIQIQWHGGKKTCSFLTLLPLVSRKIKTNIHLEKGKQAEHMHTQKNIRAVKPGCWGHRPMMTCAILFAAY